MLACCDVTALEPDETPDRVARLAMRALAPMPGDASVPHAAALCTWPRLIDPARKILSGSEVRVAAVAGDFPAGRAPLKEKLAEITGARARGAQEIDAVMDRSALHEGRFKNAYEEVAAFRESASSATLKVILETGELRDFGLIRQAGLVALVGGADMVKTSTGKVTRGASLSAALVLLDALGDFRAATGVEAGLKVAGGIRRVDQALRYAALVRRERGPSGLVSERFRMGASSLLDQLVKALSSQQSAN